MVPDIIDVDDVTVKPREPAGFDSEMFRATLKSVFLVGTVISSYLFLNPVFLQSIPFHEMIVIIMLLSFFIPAFVVPYILTMDLNALAHSKGNRPYRLWVGYRTKMFRLGFYIALFLTLLWVCLFTGEDMVRILLSYVSYMAFLVLASLLVAFIFVNTYLGSMAGEIADNLNKQKEGGDGLRSGLRCGHKGQEPGRRGESERGGGDPRELPLDRSPQLLRPHRTGPHTGVLPRGQARQPVPAGHRARHGT